MPDWGETLSMAEKRVQRRLAAILAADVVGYSRMMREDEVAPSMLMLQTVMRSSMLIRSITGPPYS